MGAVYKNKIYFSGPSEGLCEAAPEVCDLTDPLRILRQSPAGGPVLERRPHRAQLTEEVTFTGRGHSRKTQVQASLPRACPHVAGVACSVWRDIEDPRWP